MGLRGLRFMKQKALPLALIAAGVAASLLAVSQCRGFRESEMASSRNQIVKPKHNATLVPFQAEARRPSGPLDKMPADPASKTLFVVSFSEGGYAEGALLYHSRDDQLHLLGTTSANGELDGQVQAHQVVVVAGQGICTRSVLIPDPEPRIMHVQVRHGVALSGRVVYGNSMLPAVGARVLAWPRAWRFPPINLAMQALKGDPRRLCATTNSSGEFQIPCVDERSSYLIVATQPGWALWPPQAVDPLEMCVLEIDWIVGVRVVAENTDGSPIRICSDLRKYGPIPISHGHFDGARRVENPNPILELWGFGRATPPGMVGQRDILYACSDQWPSMGPIDVDISVPGYAATGVEVHALPTDRGMPEVRVPLARDTTGLSASNLSLDFTNPPRCTLMALSRKGGIGYMQWGDYRLEIQDCRPATFAQVRVEDDECVVRFNNAGIAPHEIKVARGERHFLVDMSEFDAGEVRLVLPDLTRYTGPAEFIASDDGLSYYGPITFDQGPYIFLHKIGNLMSIQGITPETAEIQALEGNALEARIAWQ